MFVGIIIIIPLHLPASDYTHYRRLVEGDTSGLDTLLLAERLDFMFGEFFNIHCNLRTIHHDDASLAAWPLPYDGHESFITGQNGIMSECEP